MNLDVNTLFMVTIYVEAILVIAIAIRVGAEHGDPRGRLVGLCSVSYTHLTLPTTREV